jgi:pyruvate dehydrogenase E1 component beta subunit
MAVMTYREALNQALREEMERDPNVFIMGEDVGVFGGSFRVTEGLLDIFGEKRVIDTPIAEESIVGVGVGAAMLGLRPVVEIMTVNFALKAMDMIVNSAAHIRYMFGGQATLPLVIRMPGGGGHQLSAQHSHSFEAMFAHIPGLIVVAPSTPADAKALLISAIRDDNPWVFIENEGLYNIRGAVPENLPPLSYGSAAVRKEGTDLTLIGVSRMSILSQEAADRLEKQGISCEVIDLRSLRPVDWQTIFDSVKKTGRLMVVEEGWGSYGVGAEIVARIQEEVFDYLDAPAKRITGAEVPMPYNKYLERAALPSVEQIIEEASSLLGG